MALNIQELLNRSRLELLDLSTRNRLLSIPVNSKSARVIHIFDELSEQVLRLLVTEKKSCSFLPGKKKEDSLKNLDEKNSPEADKREINL